MDFNIEAGVLANHETRIPAFWLSPYAPFSGIPAAARQ